MIVRGGGPPKLCQTETHTRTPHPRAQSQAGRHTRARLRASEISVPVQPSHAPPVPTFSSARVLSARAEHFLRAVRKHRRRAPDTLHCKQARSPSPPSTPHRLLPLAPRHGGAGGGGIIAVSVCVRWGTAVGGAPSCHRKQQILVIRNRWHDADSSFAMWPPHCHTSRSVVGRAILIPAACREWAPRTAGAHHARPAGASRRTSCGSGLPP